MSKLGKRFIELDPTKPEAITGKNIYFDQDKTIYEKLNELQIGAIADLDGGNAEG